MALLEPSSDPKDVKNEESLPYLVNIINAVSVDNHMEYVIAIDCNTFTFKSCFGFDQGGRNIITTQPTFNRDSITRLI